MGYKYVKTQYGYIAKRKARVAHRCRDCNALIIPNEEYFAIHNRTFTGYKTKAICGKCWHGYELEARNKGTYKIRKEDIDALYDNLNDEQKEIMGRANSCAVAEHIFDKATKGGK